MPKTATLSKIKTTVAATALKPALASALKFVPSRPSHQLLGSFLLEATGETLTITAFDLGSGVTLSVPCDGGNFRICVDARKLHDCVAMLSDDLELIYTPEDGDKSAVFTVLCGRSRYKFPVMMPDEYPALPTVEDAESFSIPGTALDAALDKVLYASSGDETKMVLCGVHFAGTAETLELAATDGHRLAVTRADADGIGAEFTLPSKTLNHLNVLDLGDFIEVEINPSNARFSDGRNVLVSRVLEGQYPNYRQLIPAQFAHQLVINRTELIRALERLAPVAAAKNDIIKLEITEDSTTITADAGDNFDGQELLDAGLGDDNIDIAFNIKYLLGAVKYRDGETVMLNMNTPTSPATITSDSDPTVALVMPVQIRGNT